MILLQIAVTNENTEENDFNISPCLLKSVQQFAMACARYAFFITECISLFIRTTNILNGSLDIAQGS